VQEKKGYEMQRLIEDERLNEHEHIYTDRSLKGRKSGLCGSNALFHAKVLIVTTQTAIFNAKMFVILKAMDETNCSRIIMTDLLSGLTALEKVFLARTHWRIKF
jgi:hypothetical protein